MEDLIISLAGKSDIEGIVELWKEGTVFHQEVEPEIFSLDQNFEQKYKEKVQAVLENKDSKIFVAKDKADIVGCIIGYTKYPPSIFKQEMLGYIDLLYVKKEYRLNGAGKLLLKRLEEYFDSMEIKYVELNCYIKNDTGLDFWNRNNYFPTSVKLRKQIEKEHIF
jgi:ribosomal protein S18 acetylase RimI-like enzyme